MKKPLKLLAVLAHPDDESLGFGGTLAKYAAEGVEAHLITATRGERGRFGSLGKGFDPVEVGRVREAELRTAAAVLGGSASDAFLGTQGDVWDTQKDMCMALVGALCALLLMSLWQDRQMRNLPRG